MTLGNGSRWEKVTWTGKSPVEVIHHGKFFEKFPWQSSILIFDFYGPVNHGGYYNIISGRTVFEKPQHWRICLSLVSFHTQCCHYSCYAERSLHFWTPETNLKLTLLEEIICFFCGVHALVLCVANLQGHFPTFWETLWYSMWSLHSSKFDSSYRYFFTNVINVYT